MGKCTPTPYKCHGGVISKGGAPSNVEAYLCFKVTVRTSRLHGAQYSKYQQFLYDKITELRSEGMGYRKIAEWLRENGYKTVRGKRFFGSHVYSILKKKREKDEKDNKPIELEYGKLSMRFIDRTIVNSD